MKQYHLETGPGELAARCILVGAPERAQMIASKLMSRMRLVGNHRGLKLFTGEYFGTPVSVVTTGMGGASAGIILPEAVASGARAFVRVGSCGAIQPGIEIGDLVIATGAVRYDGAGENWAPMEWPAHADWRLVREVVTCAKLRVGRPHVGIGVTTSCFNEGQARTEGGRYVPDRLRKRHEEMVALGALYYSMEDAAIFVWCSTHGNIPAAVVNTVYAKRDVSDTPEPASDEIAALVALDALSRFELP